MNKSGYLVYCMLMRNEMEKNTAIYGIDGEAVHEICFTDIAVAVSILNKKPLSDVKTLLAYNDVICAYHQRQTVLPMRFGEFFRQRTRLTAAIEKKERVYFRQLKTLHGHTEMCIRLIIPPSGPCNPENKTVHPVQRKTPGTAFLHDRKAFFDRQGRSRGDVQEKIQTLLRQLRGTYVEVKQENRAWEDAAADLSCQNENMPHQKQRLVSLYFLIRKTYLDIFQSRFEQTRDMRSIRNMISGPWPPFSFVDHEPDISTNQGDGKNNIGTDFPGTQRGFQCL